MDTSRRRRRFKVERLESRRMLALTAADHIEIVSAADTYEGSSPVWQRSLATPVVKEALGSSAFDLRTNLPGNQTLRLDEDATLKYGTQVKNWAAGSREY